MYNANMTKTKEDREKWVQEFMAKQQKLADAAGMHVLEYMAQSEGSILRPVITKLLGHELAHRDGCPTDCAFEASFNRLKNSAA